MHGEEGADEDDGGEDGEGEDVERAFWVAKRAEDERGAVDGVAEQAGDKAGDTLQDDLSGIPLDDREGEEDLQAKAPADGAPADGAAVGRESISDAEKDDEAEQTGESCQ